MLKGPRLTLRAVTRDDLPRYVKWLSDEEVIRHLSLYLPMTIDDESEWFESQRKNSSVHNFAMELNDGTHIGSVGLMNIDQRIQMAELGIVIGDKTQWGKGYGGEAIDLLLAFSFNTLNMNRIYLRVDTDNVYAIRCYKRCGFVTEGEYRQVTFRNGQFGNQLFMSVLKSEYQDKK